MLDSESSSKRELPPPPRLFGVNPHFLHEDSGVDVIFHCHLRA